MTPADLVALDLRIEDHVDLLRRSSSMRDLKLFESLHADDVLFIDSSQVTERSSDVNHLIFEVLPRLIRGASCTCMTSSIQSQNYSDQYSPARRRRHGSGATTPNPRCRQKHLDMANRSSTTSEARCVRRIRRPS